MKKKTISVAFIAFMSAFLYTGCGERQPAGDAAADNPQESQAGTEEKTDNPQGNQTGTEEESKPAEIPEGEGIKGIEAAEKARTETHYSLYYANLALSGLDWLDPEYSRLREVYDQAARNWYKGQYHMDLVTCGEISGEPQKQKALTLAAEYFKEGKTGADQVAALSDVQAQPEEKIKTDTEGMQTEVEFDEGVPMPNVVRPVIILSGSDYEIGYQYYKQLVQINGTELPAYQYDVETVFQRDAIHQENYTKEELEALGKFEAAIEEYAPEWIDILHGMADGACDSGIDITYEDLLLHYSLFERMSSWGPNSLADEAFEAEGGKENSVLGADKAKDSSSCSGFAAWGESTVDGSLIAVGITDDSEGNFSATVMVFPETGNNFVTQTVNVVGFGGFPNHPNMNDKGLVRVHHGESTFTEYEKTSHSAVPRGIADMHTIRFADNTEEAYEMFMEYSPGTENLGSGAFYADIGAVHNDGEGPVHHVLVAEARKPAAVRYPGDNGEGDFIYASNNWFCDIEERGGVKTPHGGYWENDSWYWWSISRNNILYDLLSKNTGKIDVELMKVICRYPSKVDTERTLEEIDAAYWDGNGDGYEASVGSLENSGIAIAVPDCGDEGLFYVSTGSVGKQTAPAYPNAHQYQPGKTGTF